MSESNAFRTSAATVTIGPEAFASIIATAVEAAIRRLRNEKPIDDEGKILLTKQQTAKVLGMSAATIDRLRKDAGLPCIKLEGLVLFRPESLKKWAKDHERIEA